MLNRVFYYGSRQIQISWNEVGMKVYENGRLIESISNKENLASYFTYLSDGTELNIQFRFTMRVSSLNLYINGELIEGSSNHYHTRINAYPTLILILGVIYTFMGIGYFVPNEILETTNFIMSIINIAIGMYFIAISKIFQYSITRKKLKLIMIIISLESIVSWLILDTSFEQNFLNILAIIFLIIVHFDVSKALNNIR